jgi:Lon protease-like protein
MDSYYATLIRLEHWLLPGGRQEIQILERDLLNCVADHLKQQAPLVVSVSSVSDTLPCYRIATECKVVDFFKLDDNSLSIVIEGTQRVKVLSAKRMSGFYQVHVAPLPSWPAMPISEDVQHLAEALLEFYNANPDISGLYSHIHLEDVSWVSQRWLEVLPMHDQDKQHLIKESNCNKTVHFVKHLLEGSDIG